MPLLDNALDSLEIAKRLNALWRSNEALKWLEDIGSSQTFPWQKEHCLIKAEALELNGCYDEAQSERLTYFKRYLCFDMYQHMIKNCSAEQQQLIKSQCMYVAFHFPDVEEALSFMMNLHEYEDMARISVDPQVTPKMTPDHHPPMLPKLEF